MSKVEMISLVNIAIVGLGYWGPNLARVVHSLNDANLHTVCDTDESRLEEYLRKYPGTVATTSFVDVLNDEMIDAVMIATPVNTHFSLAQQALTAGKHVFVEKPLASSVRESRILVELARERDRVLMAGHVFLYNKAVRLMKSYIDSGALGEAYYAYSQRVNLGIVRSDVNALWNFGPHDISIFNYWFQGVPKRVSARGFSYIQPGIEDVVFVNLEYPNGVSANIHLSWLDPQKKRVVTVVGSQKMAVYDDMRPDERIKIFDSGIDRRADQRSMGSYADFGEFQLLVRAGDVHIPSFRFVEPLREEVDAFVNAIKTGVEPLSGAQEALDVVRVLEAAQLSLDQDGDWIDVSTEDHL